MDFNKVIENRRSVRAFREDKKVTKEDVYLMFVVY